MNDRETDEFKNFREQAASSVKIIEEASSKANSEAGFAFNAKQMAEEHAKAISALKGTADVEFASISAIKQRIEEAASAAMIAKNAAEADSKLIADAKNIANTEAGATKAANDRSVQAVSAIEKMQVDVSNILTAVTADAANVAATKATADATVPILQAAQKQVSDLLAQVTVDSTSIKKSEADGVALIALLNESVAKMTATQERLDRTEQEIEESKKAIHALHVKIEGLLPGATSAGLASAFRTQGARFKSAQRIWLMAFTVTILLLIGAGVYELPESSSQLAFQTAQQVESHVIQGPPQTNVPERSNWEKWEPLLRHFVSRLPLVLPLIWFGIYAARNYMLALRGEEEYAFKEAVSSAFEGYKREMADIPAPPNNVTPPIVAFCQNVLEALTRRPGKIYEGKQDDITPTNSIAKTAIDVASKALEKIRT